MDMSSRTHDSYSQGFFNNGFTFDCWQMCGVGHILSNVVEKRKFLPVNILFLIINEKIKKKFVLRLPHLSPREHLLANTK